MPLKIILSLWQSAPLRNRNTSATRQGAARTKPSVTRLAPPGHGAAPLLGVMPPGTPKMFLGGSWWQLCHMSSCRRCWGLFNSDLALRKASKDQRELVTRPWAASSQGMWSRTSPGSPEPRECSCPSPLAETAQIQALK